MWQPIETAPKDGTIVLLAGEFDYPGDWRIKIGYWSACDDDWYLCWASWKPTHWMPLPDAPGAQVQPAQGISDGWLRAIDEALVVTHLGVANADDSYEDAKRKLNELICWHTDVATDPAVNGGFKLVPADEQSAPSVLDDGFKRAVMEISDIGYGAIFKRMLCERAAELAETASEAKP